MKRGRNSTKREREKSEMRALYGVICEEEDRRVENEDKMRQTERREREEVKKRRKMAQKERKRENERKEGRDRGAPEEISALCMVQMKSKLGNFGERLGMHMKQRGWRGMQCRQ